MGPPSRCSDSWRLALCLGSAPWPVQRLAGQAGRAHTLVGAGRRQLLAAAAGVGDQRAVGARWRVDGLLEEPVEQHPARSRAAAVEAERELVQVGLQVRGPDTTLVGS